MSREPGQCLGEGSFQAGDSGTVSRTSWGTGLAPLHFGVHCLWNCCVPRGHLTDPPPLAVKYNSSVTCCYFGISTFSVSLYYPVAVQQGVGITLV